MADNNYGLTVTQQLAELSGTVTTIKQTDVFSLTAQSYDTGGSTRFELSAGASSIALPMLGVQAAGLFSIRPVGDLNSGVVCVLSGGPELKMN